VKTYLRILGYGRPFIRSGILALAFTLLHNIFSVFTVSLVIPFLRILLMKDDESAVVPEGETRDLIGEMYRIMAEWVGEFGTWTVLTWFCGLMMASIILKNLFRFLGRYHMAPVEEGVIMELRKKIFAHLSRLSMNFFTGRKKGQIINVVVSDVQVVQESVIGTLQNVISDPASMLIIIGFLFVISWKLTLMTLLVLPATGYFIGKISKSLRKRARRGQENLGNLVSVTDEFIGGIRIVKAFRAEEYEKSKYDLQNEGYRRESVSLRRRSELSSPVTEVLAMFVVVAVILYGANLILKGGAELHAEAFIGFIALFGSFIAPIKTFSSAMARIQKGIASYLRIEEFLAIPETVTENPGAIPKKEFEHSIEYRDVQFRYENDKVLHGISFTVGKGETVALVGPSGSGKSTIADLLPRFYDPTGGAIVIDGLDIRTYKVEGLRSLFGIVSQEGILFNDSIAANIAFGDPVPDEKRIREAAAAANALEFIETQPFGMLTRIGERGTRLSGGQRQRIAIARALYRNPPILILDEATSALDAGSEALVQEALEKLMAGRTVIVIAHRMSTILRADQILVIDQGKIVQSGIHRDLLKADGLYKDLHDIQFRY